MIRRRAQKLHRKAVWERLGSVAGPMGTVAFSALGIATGYSPVQLVVFAIAVAWSLGGAYVLNRGTWQGRLAEDAAFATGLEFCRREIERGIYFHRRFLLWVFAPIILAVGALVVPQLAIGFRAGGMLANSIPFLTLFALWVIGVFVIRSWKWRTMQREIDELNDIERENRI
ncbi:MAG TPA: hypothetical protein VK335_21220 [Bryobacteraceae bacterium]|nr:hypothetical protein [Bryobacteraceae bacterium]